MLIVLLCGRDWRENAAFVHGIRKPESTRRCMACLFLVFSSGFISECAPDPSGTDAIPLSERCISEWIKYY